MGLIGFLAASLPVLSLGIGGVELAHWMQIRQSLSLLLMDAARAGATHRAEPRILAAAFEGGLHFLYPAKGEPQRILQERRGALSLPWHITILSPVPATFTDHADPDLPEKRAYRGQALIRNDRQDAQHSARLAQGWPLGRGAASGFTIYEANTLKLRLHWPHRPITPGGSALIRSLAPLARDPLNRHWMQAGYLPFLRQVSVAMQSPPALWPDLPDGRVTHASIARPAPPATSPEAPDTIDNPSAPPMDKMGASSETDNDAATKTQEPPASDGVDGTPDDGSADPGSPEAEGCSPS